MFPDTLTVHLIRGEEPSYEAVFSDSIRNAKSRLHFIILHCVEVTSALPRGFSFYQLSRLTEEWVVCTSSRNDIYSRASRAALLR
ncbi:hypothetical protein BDQ17DRAFT_995410 [Cyathus striatus]|nr:hypothetical protein BDQ17DRAFT_995410 [Cyathus striatus]